MKITKENFDVLAIKAYDPSQCTGIDEVYNDIERFIYVGKLFMLYSSGGELNERLIMNHIITLFNVFGTETIRFLFFRIKPEFHKMLVPFLAYLNRLDDFVEINGKNVLVSKIGYDQFVLERLQSI